MKRVFKHNPDVVYRKIADEYILVPIHRNVGDMDDCIYTLNAMGAAIWEMINGKRSEEEIRDLITKDFEVEKIEAQNDLEKYIRKLQESGAIILVES